MKYYSECCAEEMINWPDSDLCPLCHEHTGVEEEEEYEGEKEFNDKLLLSDEKNKALKEEKSWEKFSGHEK
jgi:hypothetical protein